MAQIDDLTTYNRKGLRIMLYRGWIDGQWKITPNLTDLDGIESVDIFFNGFWTVYY